jgi:Fe-S-cluster containining protein
MDPELFDRLTANYRQLIQRIDTHISGLHNRHPDAIACKKGCDACCRRLTLFPIEAFCLAAAYEHLEDTVKQQIAQQINTRPQTCPLLIDHNCALYASRPVICRTHGYPVTMEKEGGIEVDFCPENFSGATGFDQEDLLSLDTLNTMLFAINRQFTAAIDTDPPLPERIDIADALFLL